MSIHAKGQERLHMEAARLHLKAALLPQTPLHAKDHRMRLADYHLQKVLFPEKFVEIPK